MTRPSEARAGASPAWRWALPLAAALGLTAVVLTSCSRTTAGSAVAAVSSSPGRGTSASVPATSCQLGRAALLGPRLPGFAAFVGFSQVSLPVRSVTAHPLWFQRDYVCGRYYGFVTTAALRGAYRRQNNATARAAGYPIRKWPYVPLAGGIVTRLRHGVLEIYEGVYQFRSAAAAHAYLRVVRGGPATTRVTGATIPGSFTATSTVLGPHPGTDEHVIRVTGQVGTFDVTASLQGGQSLAWPDVRPYWQQTWNRLERINDFRSQG
jgi:hypothetical protein